MVAFNKRTKDSSKTARGSVVIDTSGLMDGRILELAKTGFLPEQLIVPQFVVAEMQLLADGSDSHKRARARFGLDVVSNLQSSDLHTVTLERTPLAKGEHVDDKLIELAKAEGAMLYTTDYNLNKVAQIEGIVVLNVNELAQVLRPVVIPGESTKVKIIQKGSGKGQGVGYLEDGTMVVVDNAARRIGDTVSVEFSRTFQTEAGKMLFATLKNDRSAKKSSSPRRSGNRNQNRSSRRRE